MNPILVWFIAVSLALWIGQVTMFNLYRAFTTLKTVPDRPMGGFINRNKWPFLVCLMTSLILFIWLQQSKVDGIALDSIWEAVAVALLVTCGAVFWMLFYYPFDRLGDIIDPLVDQRIEKWSSRMNGWFKKRGQP